MTSTKRLYVAVMTAMVILLSASSCNNNKSHQGDLPKEMPTDTIPEEHADTLKAEKKDSLPEERFEINSSDEALQVLRDLPESERYMQGVLPSMAKYAPEYLEKILNSSYDRFIVVDKAGMNVILYDKYGNVERKYGMACSKKYGTKHKKADNRTPEGFFSVEGIYDSTDWLFTDDDGKTSKKKGQFGPRFIRLRIPNTSQIGIHGTCAPWSIGSRSSHGCIRIKNENILELVELVEVGMPVIVLPGKRDRKVNYEEGVNIAYFPTSAKYAASATEKEALKKQLEKEKEREEREEREAIESTEAIEKSPEKIEKDTMKSEKTVILPDTSAHRGTRPVHETGHPAE